jgi:hypothetical protein
MANTYDTSGEPLGSTAPKVLYNNAGNFDLAINSQQNSWTDRPPFNRNRLTLWGAEQMWLQFLANSGYEPVHLVYVDGVPLQVDRPTQLIDRAGISYRVKLPSSFPVMLTGTWATDQNLLVDVADAALRQELAGADGVDLVTGATPQVLTLAALKARVGRYDKDQVALLSNEATTPGRGFRHYYWDAASTQTEQIPLIVQATGVTNGRWKQVEVVTLRSSDWGWVGNGDDITTKFADLMTYVGSLGAIGKHVTFQVEAGEYTASTWPNCAYRGFRMEALGEVIFTNTGTGYNFVLDGGALAGMRMDGVSIGSPERPFTFRGGATKGGGIYARALVGKDVKVYANVYGCGTSSAAFRSEWCVLCEFHLNVTPGDLSTGAEAWYQGGQPAAGISLSQRLSGEQTSYCWFPNLVTNACQVGIYLDSTLGNNLEHGDSEYSSVFGLLTTVNALKDKITGMNFEVNPTDINCLGNGLVFLNAHCVSMVFVTGSEGCKAVSCLVDTILVNSGVIGTHIALTSFSRGLSSSDITDNGTDTRHTANYNMTTKKYQNAPRTVFAPVVSFPGGIFTWTNTTGDTVLVQGTGGTISNVSVGAGADVATIPYPMPRISVMNGEDIKFAGSGALAFRVWRGQ